MGIETLKDRSLIFSDEAVRHKILDLIGDIFLLGRSVEGHFEVFCGGHSLTHELLKTITSDQANWKLIDENSSMAHQAIVKSQREISAAI